MQRKSASFLLSLATLPCLTAAAFAQGSLQDLGTLGGPTARAEDVSADGAVIVGTASRVAGASSAFYWSAATGMVDIVPQPPGVLRPSQATLVSEDGQVVVGTYSFGSYRFAFRWSSATGVERLGSLDPSGFGSVVPNAVSSDGSVIVGEAQTSAGEWHAFRWTAATGLVDLGTFGGSHSFAKAVSADGAVVVGHAHATNWHSRAFRWTAATGLVDLGTLGGPHSLATAISADGAVVVGTASGASHPNRAFRWTSATGMQDLGTLGGATSFGEHVSDDGSVVAGNATFGPSSALHAFRWTAATGMVDLGTFGGLQSFATALSADGSVVVGRANSTLSLIGRGFRWSAATGLVELGTLGGPSTTPEALSADGAIVVGHSEALRANRAFRAEDGVRGPIGTRYCAPATSNSTGASGRLEVLGSNAVSVDDVTLEATDLPLQSAGYFLASATQGFVPLAGGSQGTLCLGGAIGRFVAPGQVQSSGSTGTFGLTIDVHAIPQPTGPITPAFGETWNFQAWYRDVVGGAATSNFTDAVAVTFR